MAYRHETSSATTLTDSSGRFHVRTVQPPKAHTVQAHVQQGGGSTRAILLQSSEVGRLRKQVSFLFPKPVRTEPDNADKKTCVSFQERESTSRFSRKAMPSLAGTRRLLLSRC